MGVIILIILLPGTNVEKVLSFSVLVAEINCQVPVMGKGLGFTPSCGGFVLQEIKITAITRVLIFNNIFFILTVIVPIEVL